MILTCVNTTYVSIFSLCSPPLSIHPFPFNHYDDILNVQAHFQDSFCWRWAVFWIFLTDIDRMRVVVCFYWQDRLKEHFQSHKNCNGLYIRLGKVRVFEQQSALCTDVPQKQECTMERDLFGRCRWNIREAVIEKASEACSRFSSITPVLTRMQRRTNVMRLAGAGHQKQIHVCFNATSLLTDLIPFYSRIFWISSINETKIEEGQQMGSRQEKEWLR